MANRTGIWINERQFVTFSEAQRTGDPLIGEIATRGRTMDFMAILGYLPNPDPVLKKLGKDISVYRDLTVDAHIFAYIQSRKAGTMSLEWAVDKGKAKSRQAKVVEDVFNSLDLYRIISEILDAALYGYQPLEVFWEYRGGLILPADVMAKPQEWFIFDDENKLRLRTKESYLLGEELPDRKFLLARVNPSYQNPYGEPFMSRCFWPASFKKGGWRWWVTFAEKYGMPFLLGKHPRGTPPKEVDDFLGMLEKMVQDAIAVVPNDSTIELMESGSKGGSKSTSLYKELLETCNAELSKAIVGQTLTTEIGEKGSYAASKTHGDVRQEIVDADAKLVMQTLNTLIHWIDELNFASGEHPVFSMWQEEDVDKALAERDKILKEMGVDFTDQYVQRTYGLEPGDFTMRKPAPTAPPQPGEPAAFAEAPAGPLDPSGLDELLAGITPQQLQAQAEGILKPVIELLKECGDYEEAFNALAEAYPQMSAKTMEEMLTQAVAVSEAKGIVDAATEN